MHPNDETTKHAPEAWRLGSCTALPLTTSMPSRAGFWATLRLNFWSLGLHTASPFPGWQCQGMFGRRQGQASCPPPSRYIAYPSVRVGGCHFLQIGAANAWGWDMSDVTSLSPVGSWGRGGGEREFPAARRPCTRVHPGSEGSPRALMLVSIHSTIIPRPKGTQS